MRRIRNPHTKTYLLHPMMVLLITYIVLQLAIFLHVRVENITGIVGNILLVFVAPLSFFIINYLLKDTSKPTLSLLKKIGLIALFILFIFLSTIFTTIIMEQFIPQTSNTNTALNPKTTVEIAIVFITLAWTLLGEEAIRLGTFFFLYGDMAYDKNRKLAYWVMWIATSLIFGLMHLTVYNFNLLQCLFVIGLPEAMFGFLWKKTQRPWMLWTVHFLYDFILLGVVFLVI